MNIYKHKKFIEKVIKSCKNEWHLETSKTLVDNLYKRFNDEEDLNLAFYKFEMLYYFYNLIKQQREYIKESYNVKCC